MEISTLIQIALRVAVVYAVVLVGIRLTGKREVGQMSPFDLVLLLLIANAVQNAMTGPDTSLKGGIIAAATLLGLNAFIARFVLKRKKWREVIEGVPTILIHDGKIIEANLIHERISRDILDQALREHGASSPAEVELAVLEVDGSVSVIRYVDLPTPPHPPRHFRVLKKK